MKPSLPKEELSEKSEEIWNSLCILEKLYCKYCFLQDTSISTVFVGVFSAYLVNIFTSIAGITFSGIIHIVAYSLNAIASVFIFIYVVKLYSIHVESKEKSNSKAGARSSHVTLELKHFKDNRKEIWRALRCFLIGMLFMFITLVVCCVINNLNLDAPSAPLETESNATTPAR